MIIGLILLNLVSCFGSSHEERLPCSIGKLSRDQVLWSICQIMCLIVFSSQCLFSSCVKGHQWMDVLDYNHRDAQHSDPYLISFICDKKSCDCGLQIFVLAD